MKTGKMDKYRMKKKVQEIRDSASKFASIRLSRGSLRIQNGAFATALEWKERRTSQPNRIARINEKLK